MWRTCPGLINTEPRAVSSDCECVVVAPGTGEPSSNQIDSRGDLFAVSFDASVDERFSVLMDVNAFKAGIASIGRRC
jgi:hypothetical protein